MKTLVGSQNPVKIDAVREAFGKYFNKNEIIGYSVSSDVPDQPVNDQVFEGAKNRAEALKLIDKDKNIGADFFVGIEGGIAKLYNKWFALGLMCVINKDNQYSFGTSPLFELPQTVIEELLNGTELGTVIDKLSGHENTKQKGGAIGYFTKGVMDRKELYVSGLITALVPFNHKELFF